MSVPFSAKRSHRRRITGTCHSIWIWLHGSVGICTSGMPSPSVQKAMLTPSFVLAYWMRGSAIGSTSHREQPLRVGDALKGLLAPVVEGHSSRRPRQSTHGVRYQHLARRRERRDAGGDVDGAAVDVVPLSDDVSGVDAEMQAQPQR